MATLISAIGTCFFAMHAQVQIGSDVFLQRSVCHKAQLRNVGQGLGRVATRPQFLQEVSQANGQAYAHNKLHFNFRKSSGNYNPEATPCKS